MTTRPEDLWERGAETYANAFDGLVTKAIDPTLDAAKVSSGTKLLDVATGPGLIAAAAHRRGSTAIGTDFAKKMIDSARKENPELRFEVADAIELPFGDRSFDAVTMGFALFMLLEPDKALNEALRVLKPGGRFAASLWDWPVPGFDLFYGPMGQYIEEEMLPGGPPLMSESDPSVLSSVLTNAGFVGVQVERLPVIWELDDANKLFDALASLRDLDGLTPQDMESFRKDVISSVNGLDNCVPFPMLVVSGEKPADANL